jgi:hypothetical protein
LFNTPTGGIGFRDPMEGEVCWWPHFSIKECEADTKRERQRMQKQFLFDAWRYCNERDELAIRELEEAMWEPDWPRWECWFKLARKWKRQQLKDIMRRRTAHAARVTQLRNQGATDVQIDLELEDDSTYETDMEERMRVRKSNMAPPPRDIVGVKRKRSGAKLPKPKQPRKKPSAKGKGKKAAQDSDGDDCVAQHSESELVMTGGLGSNPTDGRNYLMNNQQSSIEREHYDDENNDDDDDDDDDDEIMDTSAPVQASVPVSDDRYIDINGDMDPLEAEERAIRLSEEPAIARA